MAAGEMRQQKPKVYQEIGGNPAGQTVEPSHDNNVDTPTPGYRQQPLPRRTIQTGAGFAFTIETLVK